MRESIKNPIVLAALIAGVFGIISAFITTYNNTDPTILVVDNDKLNKPENVNKNRVAETTKRINTTDINQSTKIPTLSVSTISGSSMEWNKNAIISAGDKVHFEIHYNAWTTGATNVTTFLDIDESKVYKKNDTLQITGRVKSDHLKKSTGKINLTFKDNLKLSLINISWQKWPCANVSCEEKLPISLNEALKKGINIGGISKQDNKYFSGNIIYTFSATKYDDKLGTKSSKYSYP